MITKHTPAPWTTTGLEDHCEVGRTYHEILDSDGFEILNQNGFCTNDEENEANALLVSSAPELLEASIKALALIKHTWVAEHGNKQVAEAWGALEEAINKATGTTEETQKPIGICNRTNTAVFPPQVEGYAGYCPELDEDLYEFEFTRNKTSALDYDIKPSDTL
jgi:hypothetical protein